MLPVPGNCPKELRDIFNNCWRRNASDRPHFSKVIELLELAEKTVDNNYKWVYTIIGGLCILNNVKQTNTIISEC